MFNNLVGCRLDLNHLARQKREKKKKTKNMRVARWYCQPKFGVWVFPDALYFNYHFPGRRRI